MKKIFGFLVLIVGGLFLIAAAPNTLPKPLYLYERNGVYGYMDQRGYMVISPQFAEALQFSEGLAAISKTEEQIVEYINADGSVAISNNFYAGWLNGLRSFHDGIAIVSIEANKPAGHLLIGKNGAYLNNRVFQESISDFHEGYASYTTIQAGFAPPPGYERQVKWSYLNKAGEPATEKWFDETRSFSNGLAVVGRWKDGDIRFVMGDKQYGVINRDFQLVTDYRFEEAGSYRDGRLAVMLGGKWGYIDGQGNQVIACKYDPYNGVEGGQYLSVPGPLKLFLRDADMMGLYDFSEGLASIYQDGKWGYINTSGELVIPLQFELARPFSEGLAAVKQDGKWGFIDQTGKIVISPQYDYVLNFQDGLAVVGDQDGNYKCYIDQAGQRILNRAKRS